ncbi:flagellar biosynthesis protein FlhF [Bacillus sp. AFS073361]|uniref:flagellar biosynthesis protein FlhF n=1 Tax=Bacillus sp. AFS073361 TaxID=2033511 RepID=UPI000BF79D59|nr:flagellar biosynthesis protein FlhF [Bacillus sp. AFS073361]PFP30763.1 flagellar biosynthesis protein FlhF [Bacillus sp. AFS073361]
MKTKKIIADSMPQALKMVRQQLGDNAIIVNTKAIKSGGVFGLFTKQKFEVTAYSIDKDGTGAVPKFVLERKEKMEINSLEQHIDEGKTEVEENHNSVFHRNPQSLYHYYSQPSAVTEKSISDGKKENASVKKEEPAPSKPETLETEKPLLDELQHMRKMMMTFMMSNKQENSLPSGLAKWVNRLKKQGVDEEIVEHIVSSILKKYESIIDLDDDVVKQEIMNMIHAIIEKRIPVSNRVPDYTRMINIIGPTGVGKTTSIAKLATEQVLKQKRRVAMITTDVYRIAAVEQLKTYAGILNVPMEVVRSAKELEKVLNVLEHYDLIYMDTTGRNYKDVNYRESINDFLIHPIESENYLVLSLTTKYEDLEILLDEFLDSPIKKLILTKFDETTSYGSILNIAYKYDYQLAYITNGQSVPEDITAIDAKQLARYLLGEEKENGSSTKPARIYASI